MNSYRLMAVFIIVCGVMVSPSSGAGDDAAARKLFDTLFADKIKDVQRTQDKEDDIALAAEMVSLARDRNSLPALVELLCDRAYQLAIRDPAGHDTAADAMAVLAEKVPARREAAVEQKIRVRQIQFSRAKNEARSSAGERLIDALMASAEQAQQSEDGDMKEAIPNVRRALATAHSIQSPRQEDLKTYYNSLKNEQRLDSKIKKLKARVRDGDVSAGQSLLELYVVELDRPSEARKFTFIAEQPWKTNVRLATLPITELSESEALSLGEWYRKLADKATADAKLNMLVRTHRYYQRYLDEHGTEDVDGKRVALILRTVDETLAKAGIDPDLIPQQATHVASGSNPEAPSASRPVDADLSQKAHADQGWTDVLALLDPEKGTVDGKWKMVGSELKAERVKACCRIGIPLVVTGSYRLRAEFTRTNGVLDVDFMLPVANRQVMLSFDMYRTWQGLSMIDGKNITNNGTGRKVSIKSNHRYTVEVDVLVKGNQAAISASLDGQPVTNWRGPITHLTLPKGWRFPAPLTLGVGTYDTNVTFHELKIQPVNGRLKFLRQ